MKRRKLLGQLSAGLAATSVAGCFDFFEQDEETATPSPSPSPSPTPTSSPTEDPRFDLEDAFEFDSAVNMVEDMGCDPAGERPCDVAFQEALDPNVVLEFPPGEYLFTRRHTIPWIEQLGIRGLGEDPSDVRFVRPDGFTDLLFNVRDCERCLLGNVSMRQTESPDRNAGIVVHARDAALLEDVEYTGFTPTDGTVGLNVQITRRSGTGIIRGFRSTGGGPVGVYPTGHPVVYSGPSHRGVLRLVDCHIEEDGAGGGGVYASRTRGPVQVVGGLYRNNDVAQIRICGERSFVRGARIEIDPANAENVRGSYETVRGIWWESGWQGKTGGHVTDCDFVVKSVPDNPRALVHVDGTGGAITVRDSRFTFDVPNDTFWGVYAAPAGESGMGGPPPEPWNVTLENVTFTGRANGAAAVEVNGRPDTVLDGVTIENRDGQDGVVLRSADGARIDGGSIVSGRYPVRVAFDGDSGSCPVELRELDGLRTRQRRVRNHARPIDADGRPLCVGPSEFESAVTAFALTGQCDSSYFAVPLDGEMVATPVAGADDPVDCQ